MIRTISATAAAALMIGIATVAQAQSSAGTGASAGRGGGAPGNDSLLTLTAAKPAGAPFDDGSTFRGRLPREGCGTPLAAVKTGRVIPSPASDCNNYSR